jgi:hypothetical protein
MGAFVGFRRFVVEVPSYRPLIERDFDYSDLLSAEDRCTSSNRYMSASSRLSACERAAELRLTASSQRMFELKWTQNCGPVQARRVYQPPLGTQSDMQLWDELDTSSMDDSVQDEQFLSTDTNADGGVDRL